MIGLQTNRRFVEAYMVGLNVEMGRELLWRGFPTDQRGTCFAQFWDTRSATAGAAPRHPADAPVGRPPPRRPAGAPAARAVRDAAAQRTAAPLSDGGGLCDARAVDVNGVREPKLDPAATRCIRRSAARWSRM